MALMTPDEKMPARFYQARYLAPTKRVLFHLWPLEPSNSMFSKEIGALLLTQLPHVRFKAFHDLLIAYQWTVAKNQ